MLGLVGLASNAGIIVLLEPSSEASFGLFDVDLSTRAWYLLYDVCLLLDGERAFDLRKHGPEIQARSKHHSDLVVPARSLTNACYVSSIINVGLPTLCASLWSRSRGLLPAILL